MQIRTINLRVGTKFGSNALRWVIPVESLLKYKENNTNKFKYKALHRDKNKDNIHEHYRVDMLQNSNLL